MKFTVLNAATQRLEQITAPGDLIFFRLEHQVRYGDALLNDGTRSSLISLDDLCGLVAERLAVLEGADAVEEMGDPNELDAVLERARRKPAKLKSVKT